MSMYSKEAAVNPRRSYDSPRRSTQAQQTRAAVLDQARRRFLDDGFAATTMSSIASAAGVSTETVYKVFGSKSGLVRAICSSALAGEGPVAAETRSDELQRSEPDPTQIARAWGRLASEVAPRVQPIVLLLRSAAMVDPEMATVQRQIDDERLERMTHNATTLSDSGRLKPGLSVDRAAELLWTFSSAEVYELLVVRRGWSVEQYGDFIADAIISLLLA